MNREVIFEALFALAAEATWGTPTRRFLETSRRVKLFSDASVQPSLFQAEHREFLSQVTGMPYKWTIEVNWIIYQKVGNSPSAVPAIENNLILDAVEAVLAPKPYDPGFPYERNTLNGLVHHCYIDGNIFKDPGDIDGQGMLVVPIKLLVP
jgi:hypothetical protein